MDQSCRLARRDFLRSAALGAATLVASPVPSSTDTVERTKFQALVPADKGLPARWVASLFERGEPTVYRGANLSLIGMPVSGITTGQLYLGGDGRLWLWDIFNMTPLAEQPGAAHYTNPLSIPWWCPVDQSFTLRILDSPSRQERPLASGGFADISFRGEYPIGYVEYRDPACPVTVLLEAFSPFIPLDVNDSSLPATIMRFTLTNAGTTVVAGELTGLLENAVARSAERHTAVGRLNSIERDADFLFLNCSATIASSRTYLDAGTMGLALLSTIQTDTGTATVAGRPERHPAGALTRKFSLAPGESQVATFAIVWSFPNLAVEWSVNSWVEGTQIKGQGGRHYANRFDSAAAVARYIARHIARLHAQTRLWHDTWYDSSLPHWLLERTLLNVSTLATSTAFRFADGRFYGLEGVGGGPGTCTHVWHYEQAMGRLFPELDILLRERADFNPAISFKPDGMIESRGEFFPGTPAVDGQAGTILRALRDHQTSPDDAFLKRNWSSIKKATQWLMAQDGNADGILEGGQPNTLDATWYGAVAWLSGLYLAALRAAEEMATEANDPQFAKTCRQIFEAGQKNFVARLFSDEYFVNRPDPQHPDTVNSGTGCQIDQVLGQSWAFQVGLGRVLPQKETRAALTALWRYNFTPDVGPYRAVNKAGRWYAMPGEAGLLMCTFPRADWTFDKAKGAGQDDTVGYLNECMNGFEHQVAGHMIWEGMVLEGLAVERALHERYHASNRNPWNEVEAGDHYARSMASYGVYVAACGFEYHGPKGYIAFAPRLTPGDFKGAFTAAQGWGTFTQSIRNGVQTATIELKWGKLRLRTLALAPAQNRVPSHAVVTVNGKQIPARVTFMDERARINLSRDAIVEQGGRIEVQLA